MSCHGLTTGPAMAAAPLLTPAPPHPATTATPLSPFTNMGEPTYQVGHD